MPKWAHDCDKCDYLGTIFKEFDLYVCRDKEHPDLSSYLIRCSDEGSDYLSFHITQKELKAVSIGGLSDMEREVVAMMKQSCSFFLNNLETI